MRPLRQFVTMRSHGLSKLNAAAQDVKLAVPRVFDVQKAEYEGIGRAFFP